MKLTLFHGRYHPDEYMNDWGFEGPTLEGIISIHGTYTAHLKIFFKNHKSYIEAQQLTGWHKWDENALEARYDSEMLITLTNPPVWYGDFSIGNE